AVRWLDRLDSVARRDLLLRRAGWEAPDTLDRVDRRHHGPQARRRGERVACLDGALIDRRDLLDRSEPDHQDLEWRRRAALWLYRARGGRPPLADDLPGKNAWTRRGTL